VNATSNATVSSAIVKVRLMAVPHLPKRAMLSPAQPLDDGDRDRRVALFRV
jgi:hypothetical protein